MRALRGCVAVLMVLLGIYLAGCCTSSKESEKVVVPTQTSTPTLGKELEDLEQAYKKGAITKEEYERAKKNLIDQGAK